MTYSELPKLYKILARHRYCQNLIRRGCPINPMNLIPDDLFFIFDWSRTPEGPNFWRKIYKSPNIESLPPIPTSSKISLTKIKIRK